MYEMLEEWKRDFLMKDWAAKDSSHLISFVVDNNRF